MDKEAYDKMQDEMLDSLGVRQDLTEKKKKVKEEDEEDIDKEKGNEDEDIKEGDSKTADIVKELQDTGWGGDNESQMKAVQLLKGLATSDDPEANAFMKKLDSYTSKMGGGSSDDKE